MEEKLTIEQLGYAYFNAFLASIAREKGISERKSKSCGYWQYRNFDLTRELCKYTEDEIENCSSEYYLWLNFTNSIRPVREELIYRIMQFERDSWVITLFLYMAHIVEDTGRLQKEEEKSNEELARRLDFITEDFADYSVQGLNENDMAATIEGYLTDMERIYGRVEGYNLLLDLVSALLDVPDLKICKLSSTRLRNAIRHYNSVLCTIEETVADETKEEFSGLFRHMSAARFRPKKKNKEQLARTLIADKQDGGLYKILRHTEVLIDFLCGILKPEDEEKDKVAPEEESKSGTGVGA